jgi:ribosomal protein S18 acetylase RimI-like enzyme
MAADRPVSPASPDAFAELRRLDERGLNAGCAFESLLYDGWLLGYRRGPTKRLRSVNPFYRSTLPLEEKVAYCTAFYEARDLPATFRIVPFSEPETLDGWLKDHGWKLFDRSLVLRADLALRPNPTLPHDGVELVAPPAWEPLVAHLLAIDGEALPGYVERAARHPLPQVGAIIRREGEVVACGLARLEDDCAGLFAIHTAEAWQGRGLGRRIVAALLAEARRLGAAEAYLQVRDGNAPALALYDRFGFATAYAYWYRARREER